MSGMAESIVNRKELPGNNPEVQRTFGKEVYIVRRCFGGVEYEMSITDPTPARRKWADEMLLAHVAKAKAEAEAVG